MFFSIEFFLSGPGGEFHHRPNSCPSQQLVTIRLSLLSLVTIRLSLLKALTSLNQNAHIYYLSTTAGSF